MIINRTRQRCLLFVAVTFVGAHAGGVAAEPAVRSAKEANVTGTWVFHTVGKMGEEDPVFTFVEKGTMVTGTYKGNLGETKLAGSVQGQKITWTMTHEKQGKRMESTYKGTVDDRNTMHGTFTQQYIGDGTFTGKRQMK